MGVSPPDDDDDTDDRDSCESYDHERSEQKAWRELEDQEDYPPENLPDDADD